MSGGLLDFGLSEKELLEIIRVTRPHTSSNKKKVKGDYIV